MNAIRLEKTVVGLASIVLVALMGARSSGETVKIVSPPSIAGAEGDTSVTPERTPLRIQYLIPASEFVDLPASHRRLVAYNFRSDRTQTQAVDWTIPHEQVWMSTTDKTSLMTTFDSNHGSNKTLVYDGTITYPFLATGPAAGPRDFASGPRLQTPFYYDPSAGNLVVELRDFDKNFPVPASIDLVTIPSANIRTLLIDGKPNEVTGLPIANIVTPIQFEFVPEPSTVTLSGVALATLLGRFRKGGSRRRSMSARSSV